MAYTKLFGSIVDSTIWQEDDPTRIVWITMLAIADKHGEVQSSIPGLARRSAVSVEATEAALAKFLAPDAYSRTKNDEGRRIAEIDGGWTLLNYQKYRRMASLDEQAEKNAERQRRFRERQKNNGEVTERNDSNENGNGTLRKNNGRNRQAEAEAEEESDSDSRTSARKRSRSKRVEGKSAKIGTRLPDGWRPDDDLKMFAADLGLDHVRVADAFADYWRGVPGAKGVKLDWPATFRNWCRNDRSGNAKRPLQPNDSGAQGLTRVGKALAALDRFSARRSGKP